MADIARQPPEQRAATLARLAPGAGNRAIGQAAAAHVARVGSGYEDSLTQIDIEIEEAFKPDPDIKINLKTASAREKLDEIRRLQDLGKYRAARGVWDSFEWHMADMAMANRALFKPMLEHEPELIRHHSFKELSDNFKQAAESRLRSNLDNNERLVTDEMAKLGIVEDPKRAAKPDEDSSLRELQVKAEMVNKAQEGMRKARTIKVGWTKADIEASDYDVGEDMNDMQLAGYFDPERKPFWGPGHLTDGAPQFEDYDKVKKEWDKLELFARKALAESPALFSIVGDPVKGDPTTAGQLAGLTPAEARAWLRQPMTALIGKIKDAREKIGDDIDYRDCTPVIEQLMQTSEFGGEIERARIQSDVKEHNTGNLLRTLGLAFLSMAGFLLAAFATGGMSVFIGVAIGVGASATQAGLSINDYLDKAAAREGRTGDPQYDIMSQEAVDSAFASAVLDTAFAAIDVMAGAAQVVKAITSPAAKMIQAGEAGLRAQAGTALKEAMQGAAGPAQVQAIESAVAEIGAEGAARAAGMAPDELVRYVPVGSAAHEKLTLAADAARLGAEGAVVGAGRQSLAERLATLSGREHAAELDRVVQESFDRIGFVGTVRDAGGWKALTKQLGEGHHHVRALEAWRSGLVEEAAEFVRSATKGEGTAVRTGTMQGTSDVDISTFGVDAAQNVERVKEFLARRVNVQRSELELMLDADAAVNPARMHLQDVAPNLSDAMHQKILTESARHQEGLIFARRWYDAVEGGDDLLKAELEQLAGSLGIEINKSWKPMSPEALAALESKMDDWAKRLAKLEREGADEGTRKGLIEQIGRAQAEVLAHNPNMYMDVGNIKTLVTRRPIDASRIQAALGSLDAANIARLDTLFAQERYLKILGEGPHIEHALQAIQESANNAAVVAANVKSLAKHGRRVIETLGADIAHGLNPSTWDELASTLDLLMFKAEAGMLVPEASRFLASTQALARKLAGELEAGMANATRILREQAALGPPLTKLQQEQLSAWVRSEAQWRLAMWSIQEDLAGLYKGVLAGKMITKSGGLVDPREARRTRAQHELRRRHLELVISAARRARLRSAAACAG